METIVEKFVLQLEAQLANVTSRSRFRLRRAPGSRRRATTRIFGARPLARVVQKEVRDPLTDHILFGSLEHGGR